MTYQEAKKHENELPEEVMLSYGLDSFFSDLANFTKFNFTRSKNFLPNFFRINENYSSQYRDAISRLQPAAVLLHMIEY
jgi:hypothetical protein